MTHGVLRGRALVLLVLGAALLAGCTPSGASRATPIVLENLTDVPVGLYVNGGWAGTFPAGGRGDASVGGHGDPPYTVEVRSSSNAVLMTVTVNAAQATTLDQPGRGLAEEVAVPCGILRITIGSIGSGAAPAPAASVAPGDCP
jgi:hypothetical protein